LLLTREKARRGDGNDRCSNFDRKRGKMDIFEAIVKLRKNFMRNV
jgi:hypothetical protein